jgi:hypothetical protein
MSSKLLAKLFWIFAFLCLMLLFQSGSDKAPAQISDINFKTEPSEQLAQSSPDFYLAYQNAINESDDSKKLIAISKALQIAKQKGVNDKNILQQLNIMAANIHQSRWHVVYAIEHFKAAQSIKYDRNIADRIKELRQYLSKVESERSLNDDYIATKYSGPAKVFKGKVLVAYVFVDEGITTRWSNKTKLRAQQTLSSVQQWQKSRAASYQVNDLEFINKVFVARRNPNLKNPKGVSFGSSNADIEQFVISVAQNLGEKNIGDFIEKQMQKVGADQGVVYLHTNLDQRSFARRCGYTHKQSVFNNGRYETQMISQCRDEYVMLMEKVKRNQWDKMHYAQAHEMMHVFGAADLYNVKNASSYAVTDIMNFQSKHLLDSSVEPITAYAIGWKEHPPEAPFDILER